MTAAEYRAALERYERALVELRDARAAYVAAETEIQAVITGLDALDQRRTAVAR